MVVERRPPILGIGLATLAALGSVVVLARAFGVDRLPRDTDPTDASGAPDFGGLVTGEVDDTARLVELGRLGPEPESSSGVTASRDRPGILWVHGDGGDARLHAVRHDGTLVASVWVDDLDVEDWEDIDLGPCPADGPRDRDCLYVGDVGDDSSGRREYGVDIVPEPDPSTDARARPLRRVRFTYPDGSADTEALALGPHGGLLLVTKGTDGTARLYRLGLHPDTSTTPEPRRAVLVGALPLDVSAPRHHITAAAVSPGATALAVRNHHAVYLFPLRRPLGAPVVCETGLPRPRGEGLDFLGVDMLVLTSEGEGGRSAVVRLRCP